MLIFLRKNILFFIIFYFGMVVGNGIVFAQNEKWNLKVYVYDKSNYKKGEIELIGRKDGEKNDYDKNMCNGADGFAEGYDPYLIGDYYYDLKIVYCNSKGERTFDKITNHRINKYFNAREDRRIHCLVKNQKLITMSEKACDLTRGQYEDGKCFYTKTNRWQWNDNKRVCEDLKQKQLDKICNENSLEDNGLDLPGYKQNATYNLDELQCNCPNFSVVSQSGDSCECAHGRLVSDRGYCLFNRNDDFCEASGGKWTKNGCVCDSATMDLLWELTGWEGRKEKSVIEYCQCKPGFNKIENGKCVYDPNHSVDKIDIDGSYRTQTFGFTDSSEISFNPSNQCQINFNSLGDWQFIGGEDNSPAYIWVNSKDDVEAKANDRDNDYAKSRVYNYKYICYPGEEVPIVESSYFEVETETSVEEGKSKQNINLFTKDENAQENITLNVVNKAICQMFFYSEKEEVDFFGHKITTELNFLDPKERIFNNKIEFNTEKIKDCLQKEPEEETPISPEIKTEPQESNIKIKMNNPSTRFNYLNKQKFNQLTNLITIESLNDLNQAKYQWKQTESIPASINISLNHNEAQFAKEENSNENQTNNNTILEGMDNISLGNDKKNISSDAQNQKPNQSGVHYLHVYAKDKFDYQKYQTSAYYLDLQAPECGTCTCDNSNNCTLSHSKDNIKLDSNNKTSCQIEQNKNSCSIQIKDLAGNQTTCTCQQNQSSGQADTGTPSVEESVTTYGECQSQVEWCVSVGPAIGYSPKCCIGSDLYECVKSQNGTYSQRNIKQNAPECGGSGVEKKICRPGQKGEAGIVFYEDLDNDYCYEVTDFDVGNQQYSFGCYSVGIEGSLNSEIGGGLANTEALVNECKPRDPNPFGALICYDLNHKDKSDWYLPNDRELLEIFKVAYQPRNGKLYKEIFNFTDYQHTGGTWHLTSQTAKYGGGPSDYNNISKLFFYGTQRFQEGGEFKLGRSRQNQKDWGGYVRCVRRFAL